MKSKNMITTNNYKYYDLFHSMMRTEQLSNHEMYGLVGEAYADYYMGRDWLKMVAKRYINPFSKFNWMLPQVPRFIKAVIRNGYQMLRSMGISEDIISLQLKENNMYKDLKIRQSPAKVIEQEIKVKT